MVRRVELRHGVERAAELEGTHALEVFAFEEKFCAQQGVGRGRTHHGRDVCMPFKPGRRVDHVLKCGKFLHIFWVNPRIYRPKYGL